MQEQANEYATCSLVRLSAELFNEGKTITYIADELQVTKSTVTRWLKKARQLGWCQYTPKPKVKAIYCIELNKIFSSIVTASKALNIWETSIINYLKGRWQYTIVPSTKEKLHWLYVEDETLADYQNNTK